VTAVKRPRIRRRELHWPTREQLTALLHASAGTIWEIPILLSAATGARRSEILGLTWEDVDLRAGIVRICRGLQRTPGRGSTGTVAFTPFKTKRARRILQLPAFALDRLRSHRREQLERRSILGGKWCDPLDDEGSPIALVCESGDGSFLHPDSFTHAFKRFGRLAGLHPSTRLHDVRHAVATKLGRQGVHGVIVSAVLGHASPAFTIAVYQHAWQEGPFEAAVALEKAFGSGVFDVGNPLARNPLEPDIERESIAN
jgi:integrase